MKTALITFHFVNNFGGALQAYALQESLRKKCCSDVKIIDYRNNFIRLTDFLRLFPLSPDINDIRSGLKTMKDRFGRVKKFSHFQRQHMNLTDKKYGSVRLKLDPPEADAYICGSDQIWNPFLTFGIRGPYFLSFVKDHARRIAYAPSFGNNSMPTVFRHIAGRYLSKFDAISVREKSGIQLVQSLCEKDSCQLIDPTFLLSRREWENIAVKPEINEPYMLLYIMQTDKHMYEYARKLKEQLNLPVIEISRYGYQPDFVDKTLVNVGPEEFLGLFQNAAYICTNSYHGFIFSLIFEKPFCIVPCKRFRNRIYNLAEMLDMEIAESTPENVKDTAYDSEKIKRIISAEQQRALQWLNKNISPDTGQAITDERL